MKAQCYLIYADRQMENFMRAKGFKGRVLTYKNKCKSYPYSSTRQNNRKKK